MNEGPAQEPTTVRSEPGQTSVRANRKSPIVYGLFFLSGMNDDGISKIATVLERGPASCDAIATALHRRRSDVLHALLENPEHFRHNGKGRRYSRWSLAKQSQEPERERGRKRDGSVRAAELFLNSGDVCLTCGRMVAERS